MSINWDGITFVSSPYKQTQPFLGLAGYATESWVTAGFYPLTGNPSGFLVAADLAGYATESWVTGQLGSYLPLAGGAMTGSITSAGTTYDTEMAGDFFGVQLSADHTQGTMVNFDGLHTYDGPNSVYVKPTGITFPDATMQTTAYTGTSPTAWGSITGTLSDQTDLQSALDAKYDASNPAGFVDSAYVTGLGYITQGTADGLYYSISNPAGFVDSSYVTGQGYITQGTADGLYYSVSNPDSFLQSTTAASTYQTQAAMISYATLGGSTFSGKVNLATIGIGSPSLNLGGQCDSAPASAANGDLWISNATAPKLTYKMGGVNYNLPVLNQFNTFTNQVVIDSSSSVTPTLRVTQRGSGPTLVVEDSTTPDTSALVVDASGNLGVGVASGYTATQKVEVVGTVKADAFINGTGPTYNVKAIQAHSGGSDTHELVVSVNGSTYRVGMRFVSTP
jgi:hypothetical protein